MPVETLKRPRSCQVLSGALTLWLATWVILPGLALWSPSDALAEEPPAAPAEETGKKSAEAAREAREAARTAAKEAREAVKAKREELRETIAETREQVKASAQEAKAEAKEALESARAQAKEAIAEARAEGKEKIEAAHAQAHEAIRDAKDKLNAIGDHDPEADRDERRHDARKRAWHAYARKLQRPKDMPPALRMELRKHARRMARLARIELLATEAKDEKAIERVQALRKREQARHDKAHTALLESLKDDGEDEEDLEPGMPDEGEGEGEEEDEQGGAP